jgi:excisionase family DNA binding protein
MVKQVIQIENLEAADLLNRLDKLEGVIFALCTQPQPAANTVTDYITRKEVARLFKVSVVTVHDWTKKGVLTAYKIGNKVFFKRGEVESALVQKGGKNVQ